MVIDRIAVTQLEGPGPAKDYVTRRMTAGNTNSSTLRRRISDEVYRRLRNDERRLMTAEQTDRTWPLDIGASAIATHQAVNYMDEVRRTSLPSRFPLKPGSSCSVSPSRIASLDGGSAAQMVRPGDYSEPTC